MHKIKVVIAEDEFPIAEDIRMRLEKSDYDVLSIFDRAETALEFLEQNPADILLVDIRLSGNMDGIAMVEKIQGKSEIPVVYITANSDKVTYERAKMTRPSAFLVKPFTPETLLASIDLALYNFSEKNTPATISRASGWPQPDFHTIINQHLFIRTNGKYRKINRDSIRFAQANGSYTILYTDHDQFTISQNLTQFIQKSPLPDLMRVHRSYMINIARVDGFDDVHAYLGKDRVPVSERYRADFLSRIHCL